VIYANAKGLQFYSGKSIVSINLGEKLYKDMDVADSKAVSTQINFFLSKNKFAPTGIIFVFAEEICFSKDLANNSTVSAEAKKFLDKIPFESVLGKTYKTTKGVRAIGVNGNMYSAVKVAFEQKGFNFLAAVPAFVLGESVNKLNTLNETVAKTVLANKEKLLLMSFVDYGEGNTEEKTEPEQKITFAAKNKRLVILAGVFSFLILALVVTMVVTGVL
jgi:hypothetical protein